MWGGALRILPLVDTGIPLIFCNRGILSTKQHDTKLKSGPIICINFYHHRFWFPNGKCRPHLHKSTEGRTADENGGKMNSRLNKKKLLLVEGDGRG